MKEQIEQTVNKAENFVGYAVGGGGVTSPLWMDTLDPYMRLTTFVLGSLVLATTLYINYLKIKKERSK